MKKERAINRLVNEWLEHSKIIIAVDFDDTYSPWKFNDKEAQELYDRVEKLLKLCIKQGCYITVWSACSPDRYEEIEEYYNKRGITINSINENPIPLPYGNYKKIFANIYLDDRAGLDEALNILEIAYYTVKGRENTASVLNQKF